MKTCSPQCTFSCVQMGSVFVSDYFVIMLAHSPHCVNGRRVWSTDGIMTDEATPKYSKTNPSQYQLLYHNTHTNCPGITARPLWLNHLSYSTAYTACQQAYFHSPKHNTLQSLAVKIQPVHTTVTVIIVIFTNLQFKFNFSFITSFITVNANFPSEFHRECAHEDAFTMCIGNGDTIVFTTRQQSKQSHTI